MNRREFGLSMLGMAAALGTPGGAAHALRRLAPDIDGRRLMQQLLALAEFGKNPGGGVSRVAFSDADREGRSYVTQLMRAAGLEVSVDAAGNLIGRRAGRERGLRPIGIGSHIDSVPQGGNYDGPVGSLAAVEVARTFQERGIRTRHPLEVFVFTNEEGGKTGSRVLDGEFQPRELDLVTASGKTIRDGLRFLGGDPDRLAEARREPGALAAFVELHIEQGGVLEQEGVNIGVVQGIVGIKRWTVEVQGMANHAGTTPMDQRRDALLAAARWIDAANRVARETPGRHVATVGRLAVEPGAPNVIPGRVTASLEIRDLDAARIDSLLADMRAAATGIGGATGTSFSFEEIYFSRPALADQRLQDIVASAAGRRGLSHRSLPSGAGHDAQSMAKLAPMAMIFIPSVGGISHSPDEFSRPEDIVNGANVLLDTVLQLDASLGRASGRR